MFFLSKKLKDDKKVDWIFRAKVIVVGVVWFIVALAVLLSLPDPEGFTRPPTQGEIAFLIILNIVESAYSAIGVVFAIFMLPAILKLEGKIKTKALAIYVAVCWLVISWLPHITLHAYMHEIWEVVGLEIGFHWTTVAASLFLTQFLYNLMVAAAGRKPQPYICDKSFWKHDRFHFTVITLFFGIILFALTSALLPPTPGPVPTEQQIPILILSNLLDSLLFGLGLAFIIKSVPLIKAIKKKIVKIKCSFLVGAIAWNIGSWFAHSLTHRYTVNSSGLSTPEMFFFIEVFFHWTVMGCSAGICYNIFTLLVMAIDASKSPFSGGSTHDSKVNSSNIEMSQTENSKTEAEPIDDVTETKDPKISDAV